VLGSAVPPVVERENILDTLFGFYREDDLKISLIVPCRNEKAHIREFLDSLLAQELDPDWQLEILVADGLSDDGTREVLRQYCEQTPNVRLIDNPGRIVSTGLNAAIDAANGEIIIRMDGHTVYAPDYVRECVKVLQESGADNVGGPWVAKGNGIVGKAIAAAFRSPFCIGGGKAHDPSYEGEVDTVYLGCWSRSVFDRVGRFDPNLVRNQDDEFNFRLRRFGGRIWQSPRIRSWYTPRASISALFRQYSQYGFWKVAVIRKHRALASWRHIVPVSFVSSIPVAVALIALAKIFGLSGTARVISAALAIELLMYVVACAAATVPFVGSLEISALLVLPVVIAAYHAAYGFGFLMGLLKPTAVQHEGEAAQAKFFTTLTR
jgi:succinoglycan biosynthesis protein ExoA